MLVPHQKYNSDKLETVQRRAARFVKGRYRMYESVTQMLEELTWVPLSKRRENACLILFYKIINNLAMVPHSCLEKADGRTRKKHNLKFRHIGYNMDPYAWAFPGFGRGGGQEFFFQIWEFALLGGFGGMLPRENFLKRCNLVRFKVYLDQI